MLSDFRKNRMGTVSFVGKFDGMRKAQEFIVYPLKAGQEADKLQIQSNTRYGYILLADGQVFMSPSVSSGAYASHLSAGKFLTPISAEELLLLKSHVMATASGTAGTNGVIQCDNSAALMVFGDAEKEPNHG